MKKDSIILAAIGAAVLLLRRHQVSGVGKVRRNVFAEIEYLQKNGVPMHGDYMLLSPAEKGHVVTATMMANYKAPASSINAGYSPEEAYYRSVCRQYLKLVNPAIGRIQYPHTTSVIRNSRGDVVLTYNDYDPDKDLQAAMDWIADSADPYLKTVRAIAAGNKWVWKGKKKNGVLLTHGLADELFFSRTNLEGERKAYRALIDKNGWTMDRFVEEYLHDVDGAKDALHRALRDFPTPKAAREYVLAQYYKTLDDGTPDYEPEVENDLPF